MQPSELANTLKPMLDVAHWMALYQGALIALGHNPAESQLRDMAMLTERPHEAIALIMLAREWPDAKDRIDGMMTYLRALRSK